MAYDKDIKENLADYKTKYFPLLENGIWRRNKVTYPHILPIGKECCNLLPIYREDTLKYLNDKKEVKLHPNFHHLNSSQAMCFNFFFPLLKERELEVVLKAIGIQNEKVDYNRPCFEKESEIEKSNKNYRATNFDFYIETMTGKKIYFEVKYTEQGFGKAKKDIAHFEKFDTVYRHNLNSIQNKYHDREFFLKNYQILRTLICISDNSYVVFLYPNENRIVKIQAESAKKDFLKKELINNLINQTWEDLISYTEVNVRNSNIKKQLKDFKEKYRV